MNTKPIIFLIAGWVLATLFCYLYLTKSSTTPGEINISNFNADSITQAARFGYIPIESVPSKIRWIPKEYGVPFDSAVLKDSIVIIKKYLYDGHNLPVYSADTTMYFTGSDTLGNIATIYLSAEQKFFPIQETFHSVYKVDRLNLKVKQPEPEYTASTFAIILGINNKFDANAYAYTGLEYYVFDKKHFQLLGRGQMDYNLNENLFGGQIAGEMRFKF